MAPSAGSDSPKHTKSGGWPSSVSRWRLHRGASLAHNARQRSDGKAVRITEGEEKMRVSELAAQENVSWLMPPARRFYGVMICLLLASLATVVAALWLGYPDMGLLPWVGVVFGGIVLVMMVLPRNWQRWRLAELAWDERHLYLLNGGEDRALALHRAVLVGMERDRKVGHDGQWLDFSLDLGLDEVTLATATSLLGLSREGTHEVAPGVYRFGFKRAWHGRRALGTLLAELHPL